MKNPAARKSTFVGLGIAVITAIIAFIWTGKDGNHGGFDGVIIGLAVILAFVGGLGLMAMVLIARSKNAPNKVLKMLGIVLVIAVLVLILHFTHFIG